MRLFFHSPSTWAATFCVWGFNLLYAVFVFDPTKCEYHML